MPKRPNVLLIITDEHRHDCLGSTGNTDISTPALDGLADAGTVYENAFCSYPVCAPSRYSIMSGRYAHQHGGIGNADTIGSAVRTFPEILREIGYRTAAVGKMHLTPTYLDIGFERMILAEQHGAGRYIDDYHRHLKGMELLDRIDLVDQVARYREHAPGEYWDRFGAGRSDLPADQHSTTWIGDRAVEELARWQSGQEQLLVVSFIKPHHPFDPPAPWDQQYEPAQLSVLPGWTAECLDRDLDRDHGYFPHADLSLGRLRDIMAHYYGSISQIDYQVSRVIGQLRASGCYDDTLIIFTSDHGEYLGFHHLLLKGGHMYEPLARVPLIIKYPEAERGTDADTDLVSHLDLAPTILRCAGAAVPAEMPGLNLADRGRRRDYVFAEVLGRRPEFMVRSQRFKLLQGGDGVPLFFDLAADPFELVDSSSTADHQAELAKHRNALDTFLEPRQRYSSNATTDRPTITGPNVPTDPRRLGAETQAWIERRMSGPSADDIG